MVEILPPAELENLQTNSPLQEQNGQDYWHVYVYGHHSGYFITIFIRSCWYQELWYTHYRLLNIRGKDIKKMMGGASTVVE